MTLDQSGVHWKRVAMDAEKRAMNWRRWSYVWCVVALASTGTAFLAWAWATR